MTGTEEAPDTTDKIWNATNIAFWHLNLGSLENNILIIF